MKVLLISLASLSLSVAEPIFQKEIIVYARQTQNEDVKLPKDDPKYGLQEQIDASVCIEAAKEINRYVDPNMKGQQLMWFIYDVYFNLEQLRVKEPTTLNLIPCYGEPAFFLLNKGEDVFVINYTEGEAEGPTSGASSSMLKLW